MKITGSCQFRANDPSVMRHPCYQRASACLSVSGMVWKGRNHVAVVHVEVKIPRGTNQIASH